MDNITNKPQISEIDAALVSLEKSLELYKKKKITSEEFEDSFKSVECIKKNIYYCLKARMSNKVLASRKTKFNNLKKQRQELVKQFQEEEMVEQIVELSKKLDQIQKEFKTQRYVDVFKVNQISSPIIEQINSIIKQIYNQQKDLNLKTKKLILDAESTISNFAVNLANLNRNAQSSSNGEEIQYQSSFVSLVEQIVEEENKPKEQKINLIEPKEIGSFSITNKQKKKRIINNNDIGCDIIGSSFDRLSIQRIPQSQTSSVLVQQSFLQRFLKSLLSLTSCGVCDQDEVESIQGRVKK